MSAGRLITKVELMSMGMAFLLLGQALRESAGIPEPNAGGQFSGFVALFAVSCFATYLRFRITP